MRLLSIVGFAKSGKTLLAEMLTREVVARGVRVAYVKHTHHELSTVRRGDTERLLRAGAEVALLVSGEEVVEFRDMSSRTSSLTDMSSRRSSLTATEGSPSIGEIPPRDEAARRNDTFVLIASRAADIVLVEGFKNLDLRPRVLMRGPAATPDVPHDLSLSLPLDEAAVRSVLAILDTIGHP